MSRSSPTPPETEPAHGQVPLIRWTHGLINRCVMLADGMTLLLGAAASWRPGSGQGAMFTLGQALVIGLLAAVGFVGLLRRAGSYRVERYRKPGRVAIDILIGSAGGAILCGFVIIAFADPAPDRGWLAIQAALLIGLMAIERLITGWLMGVVRRVGLLRVKVAVIGANPVGQMMLRRLAEPAFVYQYDLVGLFSDPDEDHPDGHQASFAPGQIAGDVASLGLYAQSHPVDLIVVCLPFQAADRRTRIIDQVQWIAADVVIPITADQQYGGDGALPQAQVTTIGGVQTLQVMNRPFKGSQGLLKIAEDYVVGSLALLFFAPLMLLAVLAIRLDSPGPVLFRQARTGFNNKPFMIFKFRTMTVDPTDDGSVGTRQRDDPRITRVGRVLRALSIDELPQLLNVMRGEMSIVGPRPYVPNMLVGETRFTDTVRQYAARHRIKPGITGWAQANGLRGNALRSLEGARRSVDMDIFYITHWSLWFDLQIMARTVMVLAGRNVF
jgi:putative colanic acid biosynthesis UDP-glucose lipid carrier transferase